MIVVNRMDRDTASFERSLESIQQTLGRMCVPIQIPIGEEKGFKGVVDLVSMKAYMYRRDGSGKVHRRRRFPPTSTARAQEYRDKLVEAVAESDEKLMEKFFDTGSLIRRRTDLRPEEAGRRRKALSRRLHVRLQQTSAFRSC